MGEGLQVDEARDAAFLLTGAGMWVGKLAYLTTNPMTIQEGKRATAQAVLDNRVKVRGTWTSPGKSPWPNSLLSLIPKGLPHLRMCPETMVLMTIKHSDSLPKAEGIIGDEETSNLGHCSSLPLPHTVVSKVIGVHCLWCLQCHPGQTAQTDPDILDEIGGTEKKHA